MSAVVEPPSFSVVSGAQVREVLDGAEKAVIELVEATYRRHGDGETVNPPSYFLRFPDRPSARIIALPASLGGQPAVDGMKWISSFPENVAAGIPRASAVLILNDPATGYPFACLESSVISATRTAASAAAAADWLTRRRRPASLGFIGTGLIARYIHRYLAAAGIEPGTVGIYDTSAEHADGFRAYLERTGTTVTRHPSAEALIRHSDLVVLATVASEPHITDLDCLSHNPTVLHVSLRDVSAGIVLGCTNIVDDVEHCLKADTSVHLAEQRVGHREFIDGTLCDVMTGAVTPPDDKPILFSPFGLGVLDLAVGRHVYDVLRERGELMVVDDFFAELSRYG